MPQTTPRNSATGLLKTQHKKVKAALKKLANGDDDAAGLLVEIANDLAAHMRIEQELFYPAVRKVDQDMILESFEEHAMAELALKRLLENDPQDPTFTAQATVLKELIEHHVEEEEEELFPKVDKKLPAEESRELRAQMETMFEETVAQGHEAFLGEDLPTADIAKRRVLQELEVAAE